MTTAQIRTAAIELFKEAINIERPYYIRHHDYYGLGILSIGGPHYEVDDTGASLDDECHITSVDFRHATARLKVPKEYQSAIGIKAAHLGGFGRDIASFEYADPAYPDNLVDWIQEILAYHEILREYTRGRYNEVMHDRRTHNS